MTEPASPLPATSQRVVTWRAVLLGILGVAFICGLTPYNDFVVNNTYLVGNFMPIGLLLFFIVFVMLVNAPLHRWAPRHAFSAGELAVALSMTLISCGLPSSGLMRYLPAQIVGIWVQANTGNPAFRNLLHDANLPAWLFPTMGIADRFGGLSDEVISHYINSTPGARRTVFERLGAVPWSAWAKPALTWGSLIAFLYGAILCLMIIIRRQWVENERLAFPLASVYLSLVEEPEPGRALNSLFRSRGFWIAAVSVFLVHSCNALWVYDRSVFPEIPIRYDFKTILANDPWHVTDDSFKQARLFFCVVGIVYFIQANVAFSLFFSYLIMQVLMPMIFYSMYGEGFPPNAYVDLTFGATLPFAATIVWVGRHHWTMVIRQMFRGQRGTEPVGRYLSYPVAGWGLMACLVGVVAWLWLAGLTLPAAILWVAMYFLVVVVLTKIVAETGLIFMQLPVPLGRPWGYLAAAGWKTTVRSFLTSSIVSNGIAYEMRENVSVFTAHALRVADEGAYDKQKARSRALGVAACLVTALVLGFIIAGASTLYAEYNHSVTLDPRSEQVNGWVLTTVTRNTAESALTYKTGVGQQEAHSRTAYFGTGFGVTTVLSYLRLRYVNWPLHPVGFLLALSMPMKRIWFSIMVGWIVKVLIVRFGGTQLYRASRSMFIGVIIGEAGAAAFWLMVSLVRVSMGLEYHAIQLLPR